MLTHGGSVAALQYRMLRMAALEISRSIPGNGKHISFGGQAAHWYEAVIFNVGKAAARGNPNAPETIFA
jgi:hypothetical protein